MFVDYGLKLKEQERAFEAVDMVMADVPTPYAREDDDGRFVKMNDAFANLLGYESAAEALPQLRSYLYLDFLADEDSRREYRKIKEERRAGMPYRSYKVKLWTGRLPGRGPSIWVDVHGGDVPTPHLNRKKLGQSFGIALRAEAPRPVAVLGTRRELDANERTATGD